MNQVLLVVLAATVTWVAAPFAARLARRWGAFADPGGRSVHSEATPLLGGLAIALPLLAGMLALGGSRSLSLAGACGLMLAAGMVDDLRGLKARAKLFAQLLAVLLLFWGGHRVPWITSAPLSAPFAGLLELALLTFWVVLVTNAMNLADGLDGLATGYGLVAALTCLVIGAGDPIVALLVGALIGFWPHNLPRARIFLGDTGSLVLGMVVSVLLLGAPGRGLNLTVALAALALPLGDVALSCARRAIRGKPIFAADRGHVHHLLLRAWRKPAAVLAGLLLLASLQAAAGIAWPNLAGLAVVAVLWAAFLAYLIAVNRVRWQRILTQRTPFRRIHLLARYATESLRLAESPARVQTILTRVEEDLGMRPGEAGFARVDSESAPDPVDPVDPVYEEERQAVLKSILDIADGVSNRLGERRFQGTDGRAHAHFVVRHVDDLVQIAPLVRALRGGSRVDPIVVNAARREDLDPARLPPDVEPVVDLDVPTALRAVVETQKIMQSYQALLEVLHPDLVVVVGESNAALACSLVARRWGIRLAHLAAEHATHAGLVSAELNHLVAASIADLHVRNGVPPERKSESTKDLVPRLEQLLEVDR